MYVLKLVVKKVVKMVKGIERTTDIIVMGIIIIGLYSIYMNQIELASVALGAIAGYLAKGYENEIAGDGDG